MGQMREWDRLAGIGQAACRLRHPACLGWTGCLPALPCCSAAAIPVAQERRWGAGSSCCNCSPEDRCRYPHCSGTLHCCHRPISILRKTACTYIYILDIRDIMLPVPMILRGVRRLFRRCRVTRTWPRQRDGGDSCGFAARRMQARGDDGRQVDGAAGAQYEGLLVATR